MPDKLQEEIKHFLDGKYSPKGQEMWNKWYDRTNEFPENIEMIQSDRSKLKKELKQIKKTNIRVFNLDYKNWTVAASLIALIGLSMFFYQSTLAAVETKHYATKPGERAKVTLSDGTQIWLNAGSFLKYPKEFKGNTREVYLTGEAFFDVAKDKKHPFIIHTDKMDTKVLGTSFNVQAYPDQTTQEVSVLTGRVNVKSTVTEENVYVTPGQKVVFKSKNNKLQAFKDIPVNTISLWRKNIMVFEETPLPEVIATINRNYNVAIEIKNKNLNALKINAYFKELSADQVVALVCNIVNAEYKVEGGVYKIQ
ncbi:FecR family protein [Flavobacterium johnsoniae]|uniref:Anti-FecI sigma factor, FecR n=1 Tax=Flavobacterium johnsoniae (strain ATCC 17061 / DSM 2064 / JCM 8514 / BCRC 14874 / CCUG 350202 / NBRC 14942 / NCIMB 11054 / UW101) TaxID=376686 RepID=A5FEU3_FLAJ1|nr:FecR domain-containing protein [Flavobacterium johnsoniae]ABQ06268.1 anti-FecI sigma factor, FecR [Flavobacterium johnsoniae UW101]OXE98263.1 iron dicitrate transport regulator FecR [Flavobacterium johnsoniae UW101]WQG82015.1 FecR domain-containing protein [Flavobacterium johnsoniae UW101]SHK70406.1 FecR family protein [Flavobacterium johnsoniae]